MGIYLSSDIYKSPLFIHLTITNNNSLTQGGGMFFERTPYEQEGFVINSIVYNNVSNNLNNLSDAANSVQGFKEMIS